MHFSHCKPVCAEIPALFLNSVHVRDLDGLLRWLGNVQMLDCVHCNAVVPQRDLVFENAWSG
jgi:hypothetical protein